MNFRDFDEILTRYPILIRYHYQPIGNEYGKHLGRNPLIVDLPWFDMEVDQLAHMGFQMIATKLVSDRPVKPTIGWHQFENLP